MEASVTAATRLGSYPVLIDNKKFFKCSQTKLPIPDLDINYFHGNNTLYLLDQAPATGTLFIAYKQDFFAGPSPNQFKVVRIANSPGEEISMIRVSPCSHMIAVVVGESVLILSVADLIIHGSANVLAKHNAEVDLDYVEWAPAPQEKEYEDYVLGVDNDGTLYVFNLQKGQVQKLNHGKPIECATFAKDRKHIAAIDNEDTLVIIRIQNMAVVSSQDIPFDVESMEFSYIQQIKSDIWVLAGKNIEGDSGEEYPRQFYMIKGDLVNKPLSSLPAMYIDDFFTGIECEDSSPFFYKFEYLEKKDLFFAGVSEGNEVGMIVNRTTKVTDDLKDYAPIEMNPGLSITLAKPIGVKVSDAKLRGFCVYTTQISKNTKFEYIENDEEKVVPYPPLIIVLTSCGEMSKYAILDKRAELDQIPTLEPAIKPEDLKRPLNIKSAGGKIETKAEIKPDLKPEPKMGQLFQPKVEKPEERKISDPKAIIRPEEEKKIGEPSGLQKGINVAHAQGTYDPKSIQLQKKRGSLVQMSRMILQEFTEMVKDINEKVIRRLDAANKQFLGEYVDLEIELFNCRETLKSFKFFTIKGQNFNTQVSAVVDLLSKETEDIKTCIKQLRIDPKDLASYRNTQLHLLTQENPQRIHFIDAKLAKINEYFNNIEKLKEATSKLKPSNGYSRTPTFLSPVVHFDDRELNLELAPISHGLMMSKTKSPQSGKLSAPSTVQRPTPNRGNFQLGKSYSPQVQPNTNNEATKNANIQEVNSLMTKIMNECKDDLKELKGKLNNLRGEKSESTTPADFFRQPKKTVFAQPKKSTNKIVFFRPEDDEQEEEAEIVEKSYEQQLFNRILKQAESTKIKKVIVSKELELRGSNYRGPKLSDLIKTFEISKTVPTTSLKENQKMAAATAAFEKEQAEKLKAKQQVQPQVQVQAQGILFKGETEQPKPKPEPTKTDIFNTKTGIPSFELPGPKTQAQPQGGILFSGANKGPEQPPKDTGLLTSLNKPAAGGILFKGELGKEEKKVDTKPEDKPATQTKTLLGAPGSSLFTTKETSAGAPKTEDKKPEPEKPKTTSMFPPKSTNVGNAPASLFGAVSISKPKEEEKKPEGPSLFKKPEPPKQTQAEQTKEEVKNEAPGLKFTKTEGAGQERTTSLFFSQADKDKKETSAPSFQGGLLKKESKTEDQTKTQPSSEVKKTEEPERIERKIVSLTKNLSFGPQTEKKEEEKTQKPETKPETKPDLPKGESLFGTMTRPPWQDKPKPTTTDPRTTTEISQKIDNAQSLKKDETVTLFSSSITGNKESRKEEQKVEPPKEESKKTDREPGKPEADSKVQPQATKPDVKINPQTQDEKKGALDSMGDLLSSAEIPDSDSLPTLTRERAPSIIQPKPKIDEVKPDTKPAQNITSTQNTNVPTLFTKPTDTTTQKPQISLFGTGNKGSGPSLFGSKQETTPQNTSQTQSAQPSFLRSTTQSGTSGINLFAPSNTQQGTQPTINQFSTQQGNRFLPQTQSQTNMFQPQTQAQPQTQSQTNMFQPQQTRGVAFGQHGFGQPSFGQPGFGQMNQPSFNMGSSNQRVFGSGSSILTQNQNQNQSSNQSQNSGMFFTQMIQQNQQSSGGFLNMSPQSNPNLSAIKGSTGAFGAIRKSNKD